MDIHNRRGVIETAVVLYVVAALALTQLVPNWRITHWFQKGPPTAELVQAQKEATDAKAQAAALQGRVDALALQNEQRKAEQLGYSHEMVVGAIESNSKAPVSTEQAITDSFLQRADLSLNVAVSKLDPALKAEVINIVAQLRSGDQEKIKAANAMLAEKDKELSAEVDARKKIEADSVVVKKERDVAVAAATKSEAKVAPLLTKVVTYADQKRAEEIKSGGLGALVDNLWYALVFLAIVSLGIGALYVYRRLRSVGPVTLGNIIADIRAGGNPTTAFDTHLAPAMQPLVKHASLIAPPLDTIPIAVKPNV